MPITPLAISGMALGACAVWLAMTLPGKANARKAGRAGYFSALTPLFDRVETQIQPTGFPRMTGHRHGHAFDLQVSPDTLTFRKLPALWVMLTLPEPLPIGATLDIMIRPNLRETFSKFNSLPDHIEPPPALPADCAIRSDDAALLPPAALITRHSGIFADPLVKELVASPKGLRVVFLAEEAERGRYLLFRDAEMGLTPLAAARLIPLIEALLDLRADLLSLTKAAP